MSKNGNNTLFLFSVKFVTNLLKLVITKGYGVRATNIEGQNAFAPTLCFA